jgi:hypothetical protein
MSLHSKPYLQKHKEILSDLFELEKDHNLDHWEDAEQKACRILFTAAQIKVENKSTWKDAKNWKQCIIWAVELLDAIRRSSYAFQKIEKQSKEIADIPIRTPSGRRRESCYKDPNNLDYYIVMTDVLNKDYAEKKAKVSSHLYQLSLLLNLGPKNLNTVQEEMHQRDSLDKANFTDTLVIVELYIYGLQGDVNIVHKLTHNTLAVLDRHRREETPQLDPEEIKFGSEFSEKVSSIHTKAQNLSRSIGDYKVAYPSPLQWEILEKTWAPLKCLSTNILQQATEVKAKMAETSKDLIQGLSESILRQILEAKVEMAETSEDLVKYLSASILRQATEAKAKMTEISEDFIKGLSESILRQLTKAKVVAEMSEDLINSFYESILRQALEAKMDDVTIIQRMDVLVEQIGENLKEMEKIIKIFKAT